MSDLSGSNWTEIDAGNNTTPPLGWPEGQMPSTVNDCARMMMGALKRMWNRINGVVTTTGGGYTYTTANTTYPTAYVTGETYRFKAHRTSTGNDQMQVNTLAPKNLYKRSSGGAVQIGAGDIVAGDMVSVTYDSSLNASAGGFWCGDNIGSLQKTDAAVNYVGTSGNQQINGALNVGGLVTSLYSPFSGLSFYDRQDGSQQWMWYADNGGARLWFNAGIKLTVDTTGYGTFAGGLTVTGNISVNTINATGDLYAVNIHAASGNLTAGALGILGNSSLGGTTYTHNVLAYSDNAASVGLLGAAYSGMAAYGYTTVSDASLKRDVREPAVGALAQVHALSPVEFHWQHTEVEAMPYHRGFLAQRVREVMGDGFAGCTRDESGRHGLAYNELVAVLWQAVRELSDEVTALKAAK